MAHTVSTMGNLLSLDRLHGSVEQMVLILSDCSSSEDISALDLSQCIEIYSKD